MNAPIKNPTMCVFFFSSRRRHTRFDYDWSSDVCSSDLFGSSGAARIVIAKVPGATADAAVTEQSPRPRLVEPPQFTQKRSEERRVGKECRSRWSPDH